MHEIGQIILLYYVHVHTTTNPTIVYNYNARIKNTEKIFEKDPSKDGVGLHM